MIDIESEVERVTADDNLSEDLSAMLDIVERVSRDQISGSDRFIHALSKRIRIGIKSPFVLMQCLSLLNIAVRNCNDNVKLKISGREFIDDLRLVSNKAPWKLVNVLACFLKSWIDNKDLVGKRHSLISALYLDLSARGFGKDDAYVNESFGKVSQSEINLAIKEKEESDLAAAIEESLKLSNGEAELKSTQKIVLALYDFEAIESDEMTFSAGDLITLEDHDGDEGWYRGRLGNRSGLIPTSFVTFDLNANLMVHPKTHDNKPAKESDNESSFLEQTNNSNEIVIDETKINDCLTYLHSLNPDSSSTDEPERFKMEDECYQMGPLIDSELNHIDRSLDRCSDAYGKLVTAMQSYHRLTEEQHQNTVNPWLWIRSQPISQTNNTQSSMQINLQRNHEPILQTGHGLVPVQYPFSASSESSNIPGQNYLSTTAVSMPQQLTHQSMYTSNPTYYSHPSVMANMQCLKSLESRTPQSISVQQTPAYVERHFRLQHQPQLMPGTQFLPPTVQAQCDIDQPPQRLSGTQVPLFRSNEDTSRDSSSYSMPSVTHHYNVTEETDQNNSHSNYSRQ
ncbi:hypothetical protein ACOME3_009591 [Neoechinorhynchus agilis]